MHESSSIAKHSTLLCDSLSICVTKGNKRLKAGWLCVYKGRKEGGGMIYIRCQSN